MRYIGIYPLLAAALITILALPSAHALDHRWDVEVALSKNQYVLREPIWLDVTLTNVGVDTQRTDGLIFPNHQRFMIELKDASGHTMGHTGLRYEIAPHPGYLTIEPGQADYKSFNILPLFAFSESSFLLHSTVPFIPTGLYTVQVYFEGTASAILNFSVIVPTGQAREALDLIEQARGYWAKDNRSTAGQKLKEAVERFPDGPYAELCCRLSLEFAPEAWPDGMQGTCDKTSRPRDLLEKYPNSGNSGGWIEDITRDMDLQAKSAFLDSLAEAHPNSRSAKYVKVALDRLNSQKAGE